MTEDQETETPAEEFMPPQAQTFSLDGNVGELLHALSVAQANFAPLHKNRVNPHFKSRYADLSAVVASIQPGLAEAGLGYTQHLERLAGGDWVLRTVIGGRMGAMSSVVHFKDPGNVQALGSVRTYLCRYTLSTILGVAADDDDDGELAVESAPREAPKAQPRRSPKAESKPAQRPAQAPQEGDRASQETLRALVDAFAAAGVTGMARGAMAMDVAGVALDQMTEAGARKLLARLATFEKGGA